MKRTALLAVLLVAYGGMFGRRLLTGAVEGFDALSPQAREVERSLADKRYDEALPLAKELQGSYPDEPLVDLWLAQIYSGMNRYADAAKAWEHFIKIGSAAEEACPSLAEAYTLSSANRQDLGAAERCTQLDPRDPERLVDYGNALAEAGRTEEALAVFRRASEQDPRNPAISDQIERLSRVGDRR